MEQLPDEVMLEVLGHIDPLSDAAAVTAVCRRWDRLMHDEQLWCRFHARVFPACAREPARPTRAPTTTNVNWPAASDCWRRSFVAKARRIKAVQDVHRRGTLAQAQFDGVDRCLVAAASEGCLPLVRRYVAALRDVMASRGLRDELASFVVANPNPARWSGLKCNLLHVALRGACSAASVPVARLLLELGAKVADPMLAPARLIDHDAPLLRAAASGSVELAAALLDHGADVNTGDPLSVAAREGDLEMMELLIRRGANVNEATYTAATQAGHANALKLILRHGPRLQDDDDELLLVAVSRRHIDVVRVLMDHGARLHISHVFRALHRGKEQTLELVRLVSSGMVLRHYSYELMTSPAVAAGNEEVCRLLIERGADINGVCLTDPQQGFTPLHEAVRSNNVAHVRCLLACGAATHADEHLSLLRFATARGHTQVAQLIAEHDARAKNEAPPPSDMCEGDVDGGRS